MLCQSMTFFIVFCLPLLAIANHSEEKTLPEIEKEEAELKVRLRKQHLEELNEQVESQSKFIGDWPKYSQDVEKIKKIEDQTRDLEKKLQDLEERKTELLKKQERKTSDVS